jgi:phage terminase large subunit
LAASEVRLRIRPRGPFRDFLTTTSRWAIIVAHRRAGKTVACIQKLIKSAAECERTAGRFAYVAPFYAQAKDVAWGYLKQFLAGVPGAKFNEGELWVEFPHNGARIRLYGADNYDRMRGIYLDGVVIDEPADMDPRAWPEVIRPALSDRKGWATFIGTPKGRNGFWQIWELAKESPDWFAAMFKASETGLLPEEELADARAMMTPEQFAQEFECSFDAAILGAYYASLIANAEREGRVKPIAREPSLPVHTSWDLGIGDSMAIWIWQAGPEGMRIIDHIEDHGKPLPHYVAELNARGYKGGVDFVPHDARVRDLGTGRTRLETLAGMGRNPRLVAIHQVDDGINAVRQLLPRMWFDSDRCANGIEALRQYRTDFDEKLKAFKKTPRHDWTSHTADALRYGAMGYREMAVEKIKEAAKPKPGQVWIGPPAEKTSKRTAL